LKSLIENYVLNYFVIGVIPSLQLRTASTLLILSFLCFGSGQRLSIFFLSFWTER